MSSSPESSSPASAEGVVASHSNGSAYTNGTEARVNGRAHENGAAEDLDGYSSTNLHKYTSGNAFYHWHLRQFMHVLYETVARTAPTNVLDAGCGEGFVTRFLAEQNSAWNLTGVDLSAEAVAYARHRATGDTRFAVGDLYDLPFDDDAFDTVLCSEVLEHLEHPNRAFRELHRVARRAVVVSVPREPYFRWLNDFGQALGLSPDPGHVNFWNERGFQRFVRHHLDEPRFATKHIYQLAWGRVA